VQDISQILCGLIKVFPELKEWIKEQFDLDLIKEVTKELYDLYKSTQDAEKRVEIKHTIANLVAVFDIDEYFLMLF
jgi:hypothetical protein